MPMAPLGKTERSTIEILTSNDGIVTIVSSSIIRGKKIRQSLAINASQVPDVVFALSPKRAKPKR